jgi:pentatricopeptide repeat protein
MLEKTLSAAYQRQVKADNVYINSAMDAYIRCKQPLSAVRLYRQMLRAPETDPIERALARHVDSENIRMPSFAYLDDDKSLVTNIRSFNTLLKALRDLGKDGYKAAIQIIEAIEPAALNIDVVSLNTLVDICVLNGGIRRAEQVKI